jgi:hypothetical protein
VESGERRTLERGGAERRRLVRVERPRRAAVVGGSGGRGSEERVYLKRSRAGVAVGAEMDGCDGEARVGQVVVADPSPHSSAAWAGLIRTFEENNAWIRLQGDFEF